MKQSLFFLLFLFLFVASASAVTTIPFCEDTEEGKSATLVGTARSGVIDSGFERNVVTNVDYCSSSTSVKEYYCDFDTLKSETIQCPQGFMCELGSCIEKSFYCDGPKANERNASVKHTVTVGYTIQGQKGAGASYPDECVGNSSVKEFYCTATSKAEETVNCPSNSPCIDGACVYNAPEIPPQRVSVNAQKGKFLFSVPFDAANVSTTCSSFNLKKATTFTQTTETYANPSSLVGGVYWLDAASDCAITLTGRTAFGLSGTLLRAGWNRIGSTNETIQKTTLFSNCELQLLVKFNGANPSIFDMVSASDSVQPGGVYFALVKKSCKLS